MRLAAWVRAAVLGAAVIFGATASAFATNLNVRVQSGGSSAVTVAARRHRELGGRRRAVRQPERGAGAVLRRPRLDAAARCPPRRIPRRARC